MRSKSERLSVDLETLEKKISELSLQDKWSAMNELEKEDMINVWNGIPDTYDHLMMMMMMTCVCISFSFWFHIFLRTIFYEHELYQE